MILITGAKGFVGRSMMQAMLFREMPAKSLEGNINNPVSLDEQMADVDTVIHLASAEARGRPRLLEHVDIDGTRRLLKICTRAGVRRFVLVSRLGADPNAMFPLLRAKGVQEQLVRQSGLSYTILRSASLYGQHDRFLNVIAGLAGWTWPIVWLPAGGHIPMQPLWVEDLVRCVLRTLTRYDHIGKTITVAGEERLSYGNIVKMVLENAGIRRFYAPLPAQLVRPLASLVFGWWRKPPISRFYLDRLAAPDITDLDAIRYHFGFHPSPMRHNIAYLRRRDARWRLLTPASF